MHCFDYFIREGTANSEIIAGFLLLRMMRLGEYRSNKNSYSYMWYIYLSGDFSKNDLFRIFLQSS